MSIARREPLGLAVPSLVLGLLGLLLSPVLVGGLFGLAGTALGVGQILRSPAGRGLAGWGIALGLCAVMASALIGATYVSILGGGFPGPTDGGLGAEKRSDGRAPDDDDFEGGSDDDEGGQNPWVGSPPAPLAFTTLEGERVDLAQFRGHPVVLNFWATWCAPCVEELPHLDRVAREVPEAVVLGVSLEDEETLREFVDREGLHFRVASVPDPPGPYRRIRSVPTTVYIDADGVVSRVITGYQSFGEIKRRALARHAGSGSL